MRVAPCLVAFFACHIAVGNVHAPDVAHFAINHHHFAVVAPVEPVGKLWESHLQERISLHALFAQMLEKRRGDAPRAHMVVDYPHFHALVGFLNEDFCQFLADGVGREDVVLEIDVFFCREQVGFQLTELCFALGEDVHLVGFEEVRFAKGIDQVDDLQARLRKAEVGGFGGVERSLATAFHAIVARNHHHTFQTPAEEQIHKNAHHRQQQQHGDPRQQTHRVAVLRHHHYDAPNSGDDV